MTSASLSGSIPPLSPEAAAALLPKTWEDRITFTAPVTGLAFLDEDNPAGAVGVLAAGDGSVAVSAPRPAEQTGSSDWRQIAAHPNGASLCLAAHADGVSALSGGDDGRLVRITKEGAVAEIAHHKNRWIEHIDANQGAGLVAYASGKDVYLLTADHKPFGSPLLHDSTVGGIAISPNGKRLAVAHYGGASLWWLNGKEQKPVTYKWAGSHIGVSWHPDGGHVMTRMQDAQLHGWRLSDGMEMRMQGYAGKVLSWGWTPKGKLLVTSGADRAIGWPFTGGGPWGKAPVQLGEPLGLLVTAVAPHPEDDLIAVGYENGAILLIALAPGAPPLPILAPTGQAVTVLGWSGDGKRLLSGDDSGQAHDFTIQSVTKAFQR